MDKKERKKIADKKYRQKNKDKIKQQVKAYYEANKDKIKKYQDYYSKNYQILNKDIISQKKKEFRINNHKRITIKDWEKYGIIWNDYDIIYDLYINATNCDYCSKEFKNSLDRNCDHDHDITDANNIRGFLCRDCNFKDVLKGYDIMELSTN